MSRFTLLAALRCRLLKLVAVMLPDKSLQPTTLPPRRGVKVAAELGRRVA
jgi:hypothetical protein